MLTVTHVTTTLPPTTTTTTAMSTTPSVTPFSTTALPTITTTTLAMPTPPMCANEEAMEELNGDNQSVFVILGLPGNPYDVVDDEVAVNPDTVIQILPNFEPPLFTVMVLKVHVVGASSVTAKFIKEKPDGTADIPEYEVCIVTYVAILTSKSYHDASSLYMFSIVCYIDAPSI